MVSVPARRDGSRSHSGPEPIFRLNQAKTKKSGGVISSVLRTELSTSPRLWPWTIQ